MKRGLVVFDPTEISESEWAARVSTLQGKLRAEGVDLGLVYNDVSRGDDIGYLSNLVIYWNEGVLAVPADGEPTLLTKLSKRVHAWMRKTSVLDDLRSGPTFGKLVAAYVAGRDGGTIGIVDADLWPAAILAEIEDAVPSWRIKRLGPLVRESRSIPSEAELTLLRAGAAVLRDALREATREGMGMRERLACLDRILRRGGFADALIRGTEDTGHVTVEITGEYRHGWLMAARTFGDQERMEALADAQRSALAALRGDASFEDVENAATSALGRAAEDAIVVVRWVSQADAATAGELHHSTDAPAVGEAGAVVIEVISSDGARSVLADTVLVTGDGAVPLTI